MVIGARKGEWLEPARLVGLFRDAGPQKRYRILDTSVIIDGRIADVCETGFLDGTLVIPQFVLKELQLVADSADSLKRNRGRRGLDILQKIQKMSGLDVMISDIDFPEVREVDLKLIELARTLQGKIVTNDFNLNKVAQLRGVEVLNINELANALKPVVLPGEFMKVFILKEGKEYNQGVAYLDDGTMVVVDNARRMISQNIDIVVTSVLQTTAGKMIFGRYIEGQSARPRRRRRRRWLQRRRAQPAAAHACGSRRPAQRQVTPALPLVADRLLPDPGHQRLHDRPRHDLDRCRRCSIRAVTSRTAAPGRGPGSMLRTTGVRVTVRGLERSTPARSYVFAANHQSIYDIPIVFTSLPLQLRIMAKDSLGRFPFLGWHLQRTGHLLVDRKNPGAGDRQEDGAAGPGRALAHHLSRRDAKRGRDRRAVQGRDVPGRDRRRPADRAGEHRRQPPRDAQGTVDDLPRRRDADVHEPIPTAGVGRGGARTMSGQVAAVVRSAVDEPEITV